MRVTTVVPVIARYEVWVLGLAFQRWSTHESILTAANRLASAGWEFWDKFRSSHYPPMRREALEWKLVAMLTHDRYMLNAYSESPSLLARASTAALK